MIRLAPPPSSMTIGLVLALAAAGCADDHDHDHDPGPDAQRPPDAGEPDAPPAPAAEGYLLAADLTARAIHAYRLPDLMHTGTLEGVLLGNHLGAIALPDGRVITTDDQAGEVIAIALDDAGVPAVVDRVAATLGRRAVWACADADLTTVAIASQRDDGVQTTNLVRLDDFSLVTLDHTMLMAEELHAFVAGSPAQVFASVGGAIYAYPLAEVLAMTATQPVAEVAVGTGAHGPVVDHLRGRLYISATTHLDGVEFGASPAVRAPMIPWEADGRTTGRNGRPRLSFDGRYVYGAITRAEPAGADHWAARDVDFHAADLALGTATRYRLTTGIVPKFQLSSRYALFANLTADGDFAVLVGVDPTEADLHQVVARVPLAALATGPVPGQSVAGREARASAISPDGRWAFVSHGGEATISVIDTAARAVTATVTTPTSLAGGGYLFVVQPGVVPRDTCLR